MLLECDTSSKRNGKRLKYKKRVRTNYSVPEVEVGRQNGRTDLMTQVDQTPFCPSKKMEKLLCFFLDVFNFHTNHMIFAPFLEMCTGTSGWCSMMCTHRTINTIPAAIILHA